MNKSRCQQLFSVFGLVGILLLSGGKAVLGQSVPNSPRSSDFQPSSEVTPATPAGEVAPDSRAIGLTGQTGAVMPSRTRETPTVAQIEPGRTTRSIPSYVGIGGNIGFGGDTGIGRGNFAILSKVGLTENFSARPGVLVGNRTTFLLPVTVDFPVVTEIGGGRVGFTPFAGGGIGISTGHESLVRPIITAGFDVPINNRITAVANTNVGFFRDTEFGVTLGVGYNF
ncbi:hypothetical protein V0288_00550 [Pannus brasiliensis CCIBt3594]|uniref:Outer membrane protein beta-barrel domain-containing protein n=1 Tax=Pannus brasiliensis CCIBt3594 TaxID=1427578 RepID=A0AAW9QKF0_9CHRO